MVFARALRSACCGRSCADMHRCPWQCVRLCLKRPMHGALSLARATQRVDNCAITTGIRAFSAVGMSLSIGKHVEGMAYSSMKSTATETVSIFVSLAVGGLITWEWSVRVAVWASLMCVAPLWLTIISSIARLFYFGVDSRNRNHYVSLVRWSLGGCAREFSSMLPVFARLASYLFNM